MTMMETYDAIIIGAGQSGMPLARAFAEAGRRTALVERDYVGGTCINVGCTPSKTMYASARVAYLTRRAADYGIGTGEVRVSMADVRERKRRIVESFRTGSLRRIEQTENLELLSGEARFTGGRSLEVRMQNGPPRVLSADHIFINTGARPASPSIDGLADAPTLDSTSIMDLDAVPEHLIVLGGGYIGLEFGQMFRRFGSRITIVQRGSQLLPQEDADVASEVAEILREDGIEVLLNSQPIKAEGSAGDIRLTVLTPVDTRSLAGSHLLVATGRAPNTEALNLTAAGIETNERGFVKVNERLETTAPGVYALGDVNGGPAFTHISYDDFRIIRTNLLEGGIVTTIDRLVPYTVFIDPQLGRCGLTEQQARAENRNIRVARMPMNYVARALEMDEARGMMKVVVDAETNRILGCAVLGVEGGEVMAALQVAMMGELSYTALRDGVFAHPTLAESFNILFAELRA